MLPYTCQQGRNFRETMKAMAAVAPQFGLVPLKNMACLEAMVALTIMPTTLNSPVTFDWCRAGHGPDCTVFFSLKIV